MPTHLERARKFGVELEFSLTDRTGRPVLGSAAKLIAEGGAEGLSVVSEQGSFQIELNPGPWPANSSGVEEGIDELHSQVARLSSLADSHGLTLLPSAMPYTLDNALLTAPDFVTNHSRYHSFAAYFGSHSATLCLDDGTSLYFPGERAIACINAIHVHISMGSRQATEALFCELNGKGLEFARQFQERPVVNGARARGAFPTMSLFEQSNSEASMNGQLNRVGFLPAWIRTYRDYLAAVHAFPPIPTQDGRDTLPREGTVYFWVRLRGKGDAYRLEYRPMDMCVRWEERIRAFLELSGVM